VIELNLMLDQEAWEHADALSSIYMYVLDVLTRANVKKSAGDVQHARALLAELGGAFSVASAQVQQSQPSQVFDNVTSIAPGNARSSLSLRA
jgi:flagellin-specific chaperone FliS